MAQSRRMPSARFPPDWRWLDLRINVFSLSTLALGNHREGLPHMPTGSAPTSEK
jgi:hypothetical protein